MINQAGAQSNRAVERTTEDKMMTTEPNQVTAADDDVRAATLQLVGTYQALLVEKRWDEWIELWAEDAQLCFPFAPLGRKSVYRGQAEILAYMREVSRVVVDSLETGQVLPMQDPNVAVVEFTVRGHAPETSAPFNQTYVLFFETESGKISRYREYWNPLVTIDALGDRATWTDGFGLPEPTRDAWGS
jgi:ketosteroid isomerase-like protein